MKKTYKLNFCEVVNYGHDVLIETDMDFDEVDNLLDNIELNGIECLDDYIDKLKESGINIKDIIRHSSAFTESISCEDID